jgi:hypothetical protein
MTLRFLAILATAILVLPAFFFGPAVHVTAAETGTTGQSADSVRPPEPGGPLPHGHNPPPEAYEACEGKAAGTAAQLITPRGDTITGVCKNIDGKMVLAPDFDKNRRGTRPPKPEGESFGQ